MANSVQWFSIQGPNGKALVRFYKRAFGWKFDLDPDGAGGVVAENPGSIPGNVGESTTGEPSVTVYITVNNLKGQLAQVERAGGMQAMPMLDLPGDMGTICGFTDPAGNWIGLWERRRAVPARKKAAAKKKPAKKKKAAPRKPKRR